MNQDKNNQNKVSQDEHLTLFQAGQNVDLEGTVEKVVFHNPENGFTVLRVEPFFKDKKPLDSVPCVGHMMFPKAGVRMRFRGQMVKNPRFGQQLEFSEAEEVMPATAENIRLYLGSGLIRGVGPEMAGRIVAKFGADTIRVLDENPDLLSNVRGIGKKNLEKIRKSWLEHRGIRNLMLFLQPHGISAAYAVRIYRAYGENALEVIKANPYRMAMDIRGIGFMTADAMAGKMGFAPDHPLRSQAAALYILQKASDDGHVFLPQANLEEKICQQLNVTPDQATQALLSLEKDERLVRELLDSGQNGEKPFEAVYLSRFHHCESKTAWYLQRLIHSPKSVRFDKIEDLLAKSLAALPFALAPEQTEAVRASTRAKVMVITGGPGTGKTTIIKAIIKLFESAKAKIMLAAPTGRAAKRMAEATGREAKTIHRLLEYSPKGDTFMRNEDNPLACGLLVIDEASMMDTLLFYYALKALPLGATLVLVGDVHQLPSVGPGNVLGDIIASRALPVVELNEIFRQSAESEIICNAHMINHGKLPILERNENKLSDFYFIARDDPEAAANFIVDLVKYHIPRRFGFDPINEIQLLTPMHKGAVGSEHMNQLLQQALNPNALEVRRGERIYRLHDKVMQMRNNYDKDIFNGDIGRIVHIDVKDRSLWVDFDGSRMPYEFEELDELIPAYAISIHKSQGSEYPAVVIPLLMQHYALLQRNLVYTGVTRGKKLVVLVGERRALQMAIRNNKTGKRYTWLAQRLKTGNL